MLEIASVNEILGMLDMPLMIAVSIISIVVSKYTDDKYDMLVPVVLGAAAGFVAESQTPTFAWFMAIRRSIIYGAGGFILYYLWRDRVAGWMDGANKPEVQQASNPNSHKQVK